MHRLWYFIAAFWQSCRLDEEYRCCSCADHRDCPACGSGVCYPCPYFRGSDIVR